MRWLKQLYVQMVIAILAGTIVGHVWPSLGIAMAPLGIAFIKVMRMMVPPILLCTIVDGIVTHGGARRTGSIIARSLIVYLAITLVALALGLTISLLITPGSELVLTAAQSDQDMMRRLENIPAGGLDAFLLRLIPETFFSAFTAGDVLPVLFVAGLIGFGLLKIGDTGEPIVRAIRALTRLQFAIFSFLIRAAPFGTFGSVAYTVGTYGIGFIGSLGMLVATLAAACCALVILLLLGVQAATGRSPLNLLRYFRDEILVIIGTSSTEIVLPRMISKLEQMGCPSEVVGLTVPLGYTLNLAGTATYLIVATLFLSNVLGAPLPAERIGLYLLIMLATSKTAAGVTGSGFSALLLTLSILPDVPVAAAAMLIGIDRLLSAFRALTSGIANIAASLLVSRWSGEIRPPATLR